MPSPPQFYVAVLGVGGVGTALLTQLKDLAERLSSSPNPINLHTIYVARSLTCLKSPTYTPLSPSILSDLASSTNAALPLPDLFTYLSGAPGHCILIDNTTEQTIANAYPSFLQHGISIVTPNKKPFSSSLPLWRDIQAAAARGAVGDTKNGRRCHLFHEASVSAGLPLLSTLTELQATGDEIQRVEGVFSGTMSFLLNSFMPGVIAEGGGELRQKWSEIVRVSQARGYTEPDPRDDLGGKDVVRKLTILARVLGLEWQGKVDVETLVPAELGGCVVEIFTKRLGDFDEEMERRRNEADEDAGVLRFVGELDLVHGRIEVGLRSYERSHPFAQLRGSQKSISIQTRRHGDSALILQGGSAAVEVTAMTVLGDLIKVIDRLR